MAPSAPSTGSAGACVCDVCDIYSTSRSFTLPSIAAPSSRPSDRVDFVEMLPATTRPPSCVYSRYCLAPDAPRRKYTCPVCGSRPNDTTAFPSSENESMPL